MKRILGIALAAVLMVIGFAPASYAGGDHGRHGGGYGGGYGGGHGGHGGGWNGRSDQLAEKLAAAWATVLSKPASDDYCVDVEGPTGSLVAPFGPLDLTEFTCEVPRGTEILVIPFTSECSTAEPPPYHGDNEQELRDCAQASDEGISFTATIDGKPLRTREVVTDLTHVVLPADNVLGVDPGPADFVAHGWVASLPCLRPGTHTIVLSVEGLVVDGEPVTVPPSTTTINVA